MKVSQSEKLRRLLADGKPHSTPEIQVAVYGASHLGVARIAARIKDLKDRGMEITGWKDAVNPAIHWYQMAGKPNARMVPRMVEVNGIKMMRMVPE